MPVGQGFVHPTAIVEVGAHVGDNSSVWHHAHIRSGASVGAGCTLGKNVYVDQGVYVGNGVKVQNNVSIFAGVTVEDEVFLGPGMSFTNDRYPRATNVDWEVVPTVVRRGASVGANATVVCGVVIGEWALIAAGAVVTRNVIDHELVGGNPARHLGWVCRCGRVTARTEARPMDVTCDTCPGESRR